MGYANSCSDYRNRKCIYGGLQYVGFPAIPLFQLYLRKGISMDPEKSSIDSFSVSLGTSKKKELSKTPELEPWNVLVCADLGFRSKSPRQVSSAEWNEFMESCAVVLTGSMPADAGSTWIEYKISSMRDFSAQSLAAKAFGDLAGTFALLKRTLTGKLTADEAWAAIEPTSLPAGEKNKIKTMLKGNAPTQRHQSSPQGGGSALDAILSMVDTGAASSETPALNASEALISSLTGKDVSTADTRLIEGYIQAGERRLLQQVTAVQGQAFFAGPKAAWLGLQKCVKTIGRKKNARIFVYSAPREEIEERFSHIVAQCIDTAGAPDIIAWDFGYSFTNAHMEQASAAAKTADAYKCMLVAPIDGADPFFEGIQNRDSIAALLQEPRFLPLKKLRTNSAVRCLCLCGPDARLTDNQNDEPSPAIHGCWPLIIRWLEMLVNDCDPYALGMNGNSNEPSLTDDMEFTPHISPIIRQEARDIAGLTLFEAASRSAAIDKVRTVIDPENVGEAYASCAFNILVNRVARLCTIRLLKRPAGLSAEETLNDLKNFLVQELTAYGICSAPEHLSVRRAKDQFAEIEIASNVSVGGVPARFSFTLDI